MSTHESSEPDEHRALVDEVMLGLAELQAATDALDEAVAERLGINRTDLQCLNSLYRRGGMTAGQLADESGLTPGAITTALDRLERAGYAQRKRDDVDRRRVLVELTPRSRQTAAELHAAVIEAGQAEYEHHTLAELRLLRDFLQRTRQIQAEHVAHQRTSEPVGGTTAGAAAAAVAGPAGVKAGRLEFRHGAARVTLSADPSMRELYHAEFEGSPADIRVVGGTVSVEYARRFRAFDWRRVAVHITLNGSVPWSVDVHGGLAQMEADLSLLQLTSFAMTGGAANIEVTLPYPKGTVPVRMSGGAASIAFHRPAGVPAGARLTGGAVKLQFDHQQLGAFGGLTRLETPGFEAASDRYDVRVTGGANSVTIDTV